MPKMRGFMRGKPKIDDAEWAIAQMRTAARLGDLFPADDGPAGKEKGAQDKESEAVDLSTIVVGPGPWSGGPRPPIIVVGVSDIVSVLPKTGPVQPTIISATAPTTASTAPEPTIISATPPTIISATPPTIVSAATEPVVPAAEPISVVTADTLVVDEGIVPAKPIGLAAARDAGQRLTGVMAEPHEHAPAKPIGVMARAGDAVGDDTWRLPDAAPPPVPAPATPALARAVPAAPGLPTAAHVFAKQQPADDGAAELASLVRTRRAGGVAVRPTPEGVAPAAPATTGRVPRIRPVVARAQAEGAASTASAAPQARETKPRSAAVSPARRAQAARPVTVEPTKGAETPKAPRAPKSERVAKARLETAAVRRPTVEELRAPVIPPAVEARPAPLAPPPAEVLSTPVVRPRPKPEAVAKARVEPAAEIRPSVEARPATAARPAVTARPATKARATAKARSKGRTRSVPAAAPTAYCPYCAKLLDPAPTTSRRCDRCRQRIVVKRIDGTAVYLTEAAVLVFEAERKRVMASVRWARDRDRWLQHAAAAGAPAHRMAQLAVARLSGDVVIAARKLYLNTVDRAFRTARNEGDWDEASRLRRDEAAVLYRFAGSPAQPPDEVVALFREGVAAELRGVGTIARDAELVSARCCDTCRGDDRLVVKITTELRTPRLPHAGCPRGLCRCHWDLATRDRLTMRRYLRRRPTADLRLAQSPQEETPPATVPAGQDQVG